MTSDQIDCQFLNFKGKAKGLNPLLFSDNRTIKGKYLHLLPIVAFHFATTMAKLNARYCKQDLECLMFTFLIIVTIFIHVFWILRWLSRNSPPAQLISGLFSSRWNFHVLSFSPLDKRSSYQLLKQRLPSKKNKPT